MHLAVSVEMSYLQEMETLPHMWFNRKAMT